MEIQEQSRPQLARGVRLQLDRQTGEPVLLFPEGVLFLSGTAYAIAERCTGKDNVSKIVESLAQDYEADPETLRQDVLDCLADLHQLKLVVF
jgi:coenzyme PQQ biosynthesis protein PqqD